MAKLPALSFHHALLLALVAIADGLATAEDGGVMPKLLFDATAAGADKQIIVNDSGQPPRVAAIVKPDGIALTIGAGPNPYPGITLLPADGKPWALSAYGHVEAVIANTGAVPATINLRVDDAGPGEHPWNSEAVTLAAGDTKTVRVCFGYSYGFQKSYALKSEAVTRLLIFSAKVDGDESVRISDIRAAGTPGESPGTSVDEHRQKPAGGILLSGRDQLSIKVRGGAAIRGDAIEATFAEATGGGAAGDGGQGAALVVKPVHGLWDLGEYVQVSVRLRNGGAASIRPRVRIASDDGGGTAWCGSGAIAPGEEAVVIVPFAPATRWEGVVDPAQQDAKAKGHWGSQPGTGTSFRSHRASALETTLDGPGTVTVLSATAENPVAVNPGWLGARPPVPGAWSRTLTEEFDGDRIDAHRWNVHYFNWWDKRQHFSQDEVIVADGELHVRAEKKTGFHNDDPAEKRTDYAVGWADTYGKWTQRYGYFEVRAKLPTAPSMWPGIWMMPDRGLRRFPTSSPKADWKAFTARNTQDITGMEIDIVEAQSIWGPHRFNIAMHWDGYGDRHKVIGTSANYVATDKDGFIVVGMLWLPGEITMYGNGREIWHWASPRVPDTQEFLMLQNQLGGWETDPLDDSRLPADLVIDYIRAWQREDLATPDDGAKPNLGGPDAFAEKP